MKKIIFTFIFVLLILPINCRETNQKLNENQEKGGNMPGLTIEEVQKKHQNEIMKISGVVGIGIGEVDGKKVLKVLVIKKTSELEKKLPKSLDGYLVVIEETGVIRPM